MWTVLCPHIEVICAIGVFNDSDDDNKQESSSFSAFVVNCVVAGPYDGIFLFIFSIFY